LLTWGATHGIERVEPLDEIEQENFGRLSRGQRNGRLFDEGGAVARFQNLIDQLNAPLHQVEPRSPAGGKLVNEMVAGIENRGIDIGILPQPERGIPAVAGEHQPEDPAPLREREALLFSGSLKDAAIRSHEALKDPRRLDPR